MLTHFLFISQLSCLWKWKCLPARLGWRSCGFGGPFERGNQGFSWPLRIGINCTWDIVNPGMVFTGFISNNLAMCLSQLFIRPCLGREQLHLIFFNTFVWVYTRCHGIVWPQTASKDSGDYLVHTGPYTQDEIGAQREEGLGESPPIVSEKNKHENPAPNLILQIPPFKTFDQEITCNQRLGEPRSYGKSNWSNKINL